MLFTDPIFFLFFAVIATLYFLLPASLSIWILTGASYIFYAGWDYHYLPLLLWVTLIDYICGLQIDLSKSERRRYLFICISIVSNLSTLFFFKYTNFSIDIINFSFATKISRLPIVLPPGISFFVFQSLSYTIDVYRRKLSSEKSFLKLSCFVGFFPHLVAGPIVRGIELLPQLRSLGKPKINWDNVESGMQQFISGLFKKIIIADPLAHQIVNPVFSNPANYSTQSIVLSILAFSIQIFCDFAGYTDMAIGCARIINFELPKNFNFPYLSRNITEFWRRWHMTLSFWLRDYLYIPLGGGRKNAYRNLIITMLLGGLWHGASLNFILWGAFHGLLLTIEKLLGIKDPRQSSNLPMLSIRFLLSTGFTFILVMYGWLLFRAESIEQICIMTKSLIFLQSGNNITFNFVTKISVFSFFVHHFIYGGIKEYFVAYSKKIVELWRNWPVINGIIYFIIFTYMLAFIRNGKNPFIYFQF